MPSGPAKVYRAGRSTIMQKRRLLFPQGGIVQRAAGNSAYEPDPPATILSLSF